MPRRCVVLGCKRTNASMHRFPDAVKFPEKFKTWVTAVGGTLETSSDYEYYKTKRICNIHFITNHKTRNSRLSAIAVPMLHLHEQSQNEVILEQEPMPTQNVQPTIQPDIAGIASNIASFSRVALEHNYSVISKPRKTLCKDVMGPLRSKIKQLQTEVIRLRKKGSSFKARLKNAEDLSEKALFNRLAKNLKKPAQLFLKMQLQDKNKAKGRRFTMEEKVLSLSLFKKSPKSYSLLNKFFTLPSAKAMKRLLSSIKVVPGINTVLFEKIKKTISKQDVADRLCSLMFDEMSLTPQINYNAEKDIFEGFANNKNKAFANHALVFMVKGLKQYFKQPIAYYFTSSLNKIELKNLIKEVVKYAQDAGLIIVNTVCDQSTINVGAITELVNETKTTYLKHEKDWRYDHIIINGKKIIPIFDVPHLIKGIRNNLITKDMVYTSNNEIKIVKWEYFQKVYAADKSYGELRLLDKITEEHINPERINKMRVKSATQLFSHSVAVATEHLSARGDLDQECRQLIDITLLIDNLFDSLNVSTFHIPNGKIFKGPVKRHSPHHDLWKKAKLILKTIKFKYSKSTRNKIRLTETTIPSVTNLIKTIEGMEVIWNIMSQRFGFDTLLTRNFNQDPVENFFGNIRSYGARNNSPNSIAFEGAFKALLLNNYNLPHSGRANCEEDANKCLQTLEFFFTERQVSEPDTSGAPNDDIIICNDEVFNITRETDAGQSNYVCGWVLTKCLKNIVKTCEICKQNLIDKDDKNKENSFIKAKEYFNKKWLCYPNKDLDNCFHDLQNITTAFLKKNVPTKNIKKHIILLADVMVHFPFTCTTHKDKLKQYFCNITINILIYSWCRSVNRILSGKITYDGEDEIKIAAQQYYNKYKHYKNKK